MLIRGIYLMAKVARAHVYTLNAGKTCSQSIPFRSMTFEEVASLMCHITGIQFRHQIFTPAVNASAIPVTPSSSTINSRWRWSTQVSGTASESSLAMYWNYKKKCRPAHNMHMPETVVWV